MLGSPGFALSERPGRSEDRQSLAAELVTLIHPRMEVGCPSGLLQVVSLDVGLRVYFPAESTQTSWKYIGSSAETRRRNLSLGANRLRGLFREKVDRLHLQTLYRRFALRVGTVPGIRGRNSRRFRYSRNAALRFHQSRRAPPEKAHQDSKIIGKGQSVVASANQSPRTKATSRTCRAG